METHHGEALVANFRSVTRLERLDVVEVVRLQKARIISRSHSTSNRKQCACCRNSHHGELEYYMQDIIESACIHAQAMEAICL
jgi:hypothetical protein